jgi:hypothetical protein
MSPGGTCIASPSDEAAAWATNTSPDPCATSFESDAVAPCAPKIHMNPQGLASGSTACLARSNNGLLLDGIVDSYKTTAASSTAAAATTCSDACGGEAACHRFGGVGVETSTSSNGIESVGSACDLSCVCSHKVASNWPRTSTIFAHWDSVALCCSAVDHYDKWPTTNNLSSCL